MSASHFQGRRPCVWKFVRSDSPSRELCVSVEKSQTFHGYDQYPLIHCGCMQLPGLQTSTKQRSLVLRGSTVWNKLPSAVCDGNLTLITLKKKIREHIFLNSNRHRPAPLRRFNVMTPSTLWTYLLNYILAYLKWTRTHHNRVLGHKNCPSPFCEHQLNSLCQC